MGSKNKDKSTLDRLEKLEVCIRLTKCTLNEDERISYDLDRFIIDPQDPTNIIHHEACVSYLNYKRITNIGKIEIGIPNPKGAYVIKVLVKEPAHEKFTIQSLNYMGIE